MSDVPAPIQPVETSLEPKSLTQSEEQLIDFLLTPESINLSVTAICEQSGVDRTTYYRAFKKEHFVRRLQDECVGLVHGAVMPILHSARQKALSDIPTSHHWAKMLLEMSGLYVPNKAANVKSDVRIIINVPRPGGASQVIDITPEQVDGN